MTHPAPDERAARHNTTPISFGLFQREQRSLFGEILDWMLTPLLLLWPLSLALTWVVAQGIANKPFDRALEYNLQALAQLVVVEEGSLRFALDPQTRDLLRADDSDLVYYQLADARGVDRRDVLEPDQDLVDSLGEQLLHRFPQRDVALPDRDLALEIEDRDAVANALVDLHAEILLCLLAGFVLVHEAPAERHAGAAAR